VFGPKVPLAPQLAVVLSMILHEIATNAAKYGALSNDSGTVTLDWEVVEEDGRRKLRLIWTEAGGPPVTAPVQRGFGSRLIERSARPARRRGDHGFPAARGGLYRDGRAERRGIAAPTSPAAAGA
jgi:two-component sensor histidine kinase